MKRRLLTGILLFAVSFVYAQQKPAILDSFKRKIALSKTPEEKVENLGDMSMVMMNTDTAEADHYGELMMREAEISRKRPLMAKALLYNALRYSTIPANRSFLQKSISLYTKALAFARENKLEKETVEALLGLASTNSKIPDLDKSLSFATQAFSIASSLKDDTLRVDCYNRFGDIYQRKKERLLALRNYLSALQIAEDVKNHNYLRSCYANLAGFYADIKEYDKAIDYSQRATEELLLTAAENKSYMRVVDLFGLGGLYVAKKNYEMSSYYFDSSIRLADSLHYEPLKMPGYNGLLNQYLQAGQPEKALAFFNSRPDFKKFILGFGFNHVIDQAYGVIYTKLQKFDSAKYYFAKATPGFETRMAPASRIAFYTQYGDMYDKAGEGGKAIEYYSKAKALADGIANLEWQQETAKALDSLYAKQGDFKQSRLYANLYQGYKDSLQKLGEQKDLMQAEIGDEQQRQARIQKEEEAALDHRHTVQYTGIAIGIGIIFTLLVAMGIFKVSVGTIRVMGFFSFILLFEFIILLADTKIHHWTHGEPLPLLGIKIVLIAALLPFHHWLEHKVVHYLTTHHLIIPDRKSIWQSLTLKKKSVEHASHNVNHPH